ncbi:MAG TPA: cob(I)yrinic acid a,c-diamide adenosyltransferase [Bacteroidota bacterium]|nr:cob(I)yrinic acid a,c-diamide adenosyltransferase [Bacteroidota bacterium]
MKIYTRTGDNGMTALFGGRRVGKDSVRIEAYGTVDELNAQLGVARAAAHDLELTDRLAQLQNMLFVLGSDLATPIDNTQVNIQRIDDSHIARIERAIDEVEARLEPIRYFILPGGSPVAAQLHVARTVCRRAERSVVQLAAMEEINEADLRFVNRLSDYLFVLARFANAVAGVSDTQWSKEE